MPFRPVQMAELFHGCNRLPEHSIDAALRLNIGDCPPFDRFGKQSGGTVDLDHSVLLSLTRY
jgi:hypothetical protein